MGDKKSRKIDWKFGLGLFTGIILYKIIVDVIMPLFAG